MKPIDADETETLRQRALEKLLFADGPIDAEDVDTVGGAISTDVVSVGDDAAFVAVWVRVPR
jgi:hypothetical protein